MERPIQILFGVAYLDVREQPLRPRTRAELRAQQLEQAADLRRWLEEHPKSKRPSFNT